MSDLFIYYLQKQIIFMIFNVYLIHNCQKIIRETKTSLSKM